LEDLGLGTGEEGLPGEGSIGFLVGDPAFLAETLEDGGDGAVGEFAVGVLEDAIVDVFDRGGAEVPEVVKDFGFEGAKGHVVGSMAGEGEHGRSK
jgi:hypothetical protein